MIEWREKIFITSDLLIDLYKSKYTSQNHLFLTLSICNGSESLPHPGDSEGPDWGPSDDSDSKRHQGLSVHSLWPRAPEMELQLNCFLNGSYCEDHHQSFSSPWPTHCLPRRTEEALRRKLEAWLSFLPGLAEEPTERQRDASGAFANEARDLFPWEHVQSSGHL